MVELRKYQQDALDKLRNTEKKALFDEMGLGKTFTAIALDHWHRLDTVYEQDPRNLDIAKTYGQGKTLIVAPLTGVLDSWERHLHEFYKPSEDEPLGIVKINPKKRQEFLDCVEDGRYDFYLIHWDGLSKIPQLQNYKWLHVIADEAHKIKNNKTNRTKALKYIKKVKYKTAITGTPYQNDPAEIWSIIDWLYKSKREKDAQFGKDFARILNSYWRFFETFTEHYYDYLGYLHITGSNNESLLQEKIEPFTVRRTKQFAMPHLPAKQYQQYRIDLGTQQRKNYDAMKKQMVTFLDNDEPLVAPVVLAQIQRLQQFAIGTPALNEYGSVYALDKPSAKVDFLLELISSTDEQIVIFSQFSKAIYLAASQLDNNHISNVVLTGDTPDSAVTPAIDYFQEGKAKCFLATIETGGEGIDLFAASTVIFLDRAWNPSQNEQAEDRLHREGQTKSVNVIDIIANNTIDETKEQTLENKEDMIRAMLGE